MKGRLRAECLRRRDRLPGSVRVARSLLIAGWLRQSEWYGLADHVLTYISVRSEVDTRPIAEMVWRDGKRLWAPKVHRDEGTMDFFEVKQWGDLVPGPWGIGEPAGRHPSFFASVSPEWRALLLVPGVAFDRRGYRIGYGGGYYDRFLRQAAPQFLSIGLAYESQLIRWVPAEPHDWPVDGVLTERGWKKVPPPPEMLALRRRG